jgi:hypothetical protein
MEAGSLFGSDDFAGAIFDDKRRVYRYVLWWRWGDATKRCLFIMLNPSTADEHVLDPTVKKCVKWARSWGFGALDVCNLFAWRATDPSELYHIPDPVGPDFRCCRGLCLLRVSASHRDEKCRERTEWGYERGD